MPDQPQFSIAGIPVRVEPVFLVIAALFGLQYANYSVSLVFVWIAVTFVSILVHEMGHALVLKAFGQPSHIVLHGLGGVTVGRQALTKSRSIIVSLAGALVALATPGAPAAVLPMARQDSLRWRMQALLDGEAATAPAPGRVWARTIPGLAASTALIAWPAIQGQLMMIFCNSAF